MTLDDLADFLKSRGCDSVWYFHTDHFEPWSYSIDDNSARAIERFAAMARASPYAAKLSLFYSVFIPYGLAPTAVGDGDRVLFGERTARQEELAREAVRPLETGDRHEIHLHVHHEFWTRNGSEFDSPVSRWVNRESTTELDSARLDRYFGLCNEVIGRELGRPFERWAFVHGNWALNASDPLICHVEDEIALMMRHGGWGDFSFPAGRGYCDPKLEAPFTCLPLALPRVYDDSTSDPRPVGIRTGSLQPNRFFIWNSPIKANFSSIDYYSAANRDLFKTPERVVEEWLAKSVVIDHCLFVKTHAHSLKWEYKIAEPDSLIPHCHPDIVRLFDLLARVCERARIELKPVTVNEVIAALLRSDSGEPAAASGNAGFTETEEVESLVAFTEPATTPPLHRLNPPFISDGGQAWRITLPDELRAETDRDDQPTRSPLILFEDDAPLGPAHALHQRIRNEGGGLYSCWKTELYFSTSDGSDPNTNERAYSIGWMPQRAAGRAEAARTPSATAALAPRVFPPAGFDVEALTEQTVRAEQLDTPVPSRRASEALFRTFGDHRLTRCPVCGGGDTELLWRIPMASINPPISLFGGYFNQVPTLQVPGLVFCFDFCRACESVFLNPVPASQKQEYRGTDHYIRKMEAADEWRGYEDVYDSFAAWIPAGATSMIDAACGIGQYLEVARRRGTHQWRRLVGLELAEKYVAHMRAKGLEAYQFDIDGDDLTPLVTPNSIDFITFSEAFEHVERPLDALQKLLAALRPGGRLYFSAQRYGRDVQAAVRPAEPIYIGEKIVAEMPDRLGCRVVDVRTSPMRYFIVLEK